MLVFRVGGRVDGMYGEARSPFTLNQGVHECQVMDSTSS